MKPRVVAERLVELYWAEEAFEKALEVMSKAWNEKLPDSATIDQHADMLLRVCATGVLKFLQSPDDRPDDVFFWPGYLSLMPAIANRPRLRRSATLRGYLIADIDEDTIRHPLYMEDVWRALLEDDDPTSSEAIPSGSTNRWIQSANRINTLVVSVGEHSESEAKSFRLDAKIDASAPAASLRDTIRRLSESNPWPYVSSPDEVARKVSERTYDAWLASVFLAEEATIPGRPLVDKMKCEYEIQQRLDAVRVERRAWRSAQPALAHIGEPFRWWITVRLQKSGAAPIDSSSPKDVGSAMLFSRRKIPPQYLPLLSMWVSGLFGQVRQAEMQALALEETRYRAAEDFAHEAVRIQGAIRHALIPVGSVLQCTSDPTDRAGRHSFSVVGIDEAAEAYVEKSFGDERRRLENELLDCRLLLQRDLADALSLKLSLWVSTPGLSDRDAQYMGFSGADALTQLMQAPANIVVGRVALLSVSHWHSSEIDIETSDLSSVLHFGQSRDRRVSTTVQRVQPLDESLGSIPFAQVCLPGQSKLTVALLFAAIGNAFKAMSREGIEGLVKWSIVTTPEWWTVTVTNPTLVDGSAGPTRDKPTGTRDVLIGHLRRFGRLGGVETFSSKSIIEEDGSTAWRWDTSVRVSLAVKEVR